MIEIKKSFSKTELTAFGPLFALFVAIIASILIHRLDWNGPALVLCGLAGLIIVIYYAAPSLQTRIYRAWILSVAPIGFVVSHALLTFVYYLIITPIGLMMRAVGYDPMLRRLDKQATTYWIPRTRTTEPRQYFRQY